jgi:hypothetical protein
MAFAQPANCRIARHFANPVSAHRDQRYRRAHTRGRSGRLTARMTSTNNNDIKCRFHSLTLSIQLSGSDLIWDSIIHDPMGGEHIIDYGFLPHCSVIRRLKYKNVSRETFSPMITRHPLWQAIRPLSADSGQEYRRNWLNPAHIS